MSAPPLDIVVWDGQLGTCPLRTEGALVLDVNRHERDGRYRGPIGSIRVAFPPTEVQAPKLKAIFKRYDARGVTFDEISMRVLEAVDPPYYCVSLGRMITKVLGNRDPGVSSPCDINTAIDRIVSASVVAAAYNAEHRYWSSLFSR